MRSTDPKGPLAPDRSRGDSPVLKGAGSEGLGEDEGLLLADRLSPDSSIFRFLELAVESSEASSDPLRALAAAISPPWADKS